MHFTADLPLLVVPHVKLELLPLTRKIVRVLSVNLSQANYAYNKKKLETHMIFMEEIELGWRLW